MKVRAYRDFSLRGILYLCVTSTVLGCGGGGTDRPPSGNPPVYAVSTSTNGGGGISPRSANVRADAQHTFTISSGQNYAVDSVTGCNGNLNGNQYVVANPSANCTINVTFRALSDQVDDAPPITRILFPSSGSRTYQDKLIVRGTATDDTSVEAVWVNGVQATLSPETRNTDGTAQVEWHAELTIEDSPTMDILVSASDTLSFVDDESSSSLIHTAGERVPVNFLMDRQNRRLISRSLERIDGTIRSIYFFHDLATGTNSPIQVAPFGFGGASSYVESLDVLAYATLNHFELSVDTLDPQTNRANTLVQRSVEAELGAFNNLQLLGFVGAENESVRYLAISAQDPSDVLHKIFIYRVDLGNAEAQLWFELDHEVENPGLNVAFSYSPLGLMFGNSTQLRHGLTIVHLDGSGVTNVALTPVEFAIDGVNLIDLEPEEGDNTVLALGSSTLHRIDLESGSATRIGVASEFGSVGLLNRAGVLDLTQNRLLFGSEENERYWQTDLETGGRSLLADRGLGTGPNISFDDLALDEQNKIMYAVSRSNRLFKIDLSTGVRQEVFLENTLFGVKEIEYMPNGNALLIASQDSFAGAYQLSQINLDTLTVTVLSGREVGVGAPFNRIDNFVYDEVNQRVLMFDSRVGSLNAVDLATGDRTSIVSNFQPFQDQIDFGFAQADTTMVPSIDIAYVYARQAGALYQVDLVSGEVTELADTCVNQDGLDAFQPTSGLGQIAFDESNNQVLINAAYTAIYDVQTQQCTHYEASFDNELTVSATGRIYSFLNNMLLQLDAVSADSVVISR